MGIVKIVLALPVIYLCLLCTMLLEPVQRHLVFGHFIKFSGNDTLYFPENVGFGLNQVAPFWLDTEDRQAKLFGWHILPTDLYEKHREELRSIPSTEEIVDSGIIAEKHLELLKQDLDARIIIYFHGQTGTIACRHRPDIYRSLLTTSLEHTHIFTIDYRGFGLSTGQPTEDDVIRDGAYIVQEIARRTGLDPQTRISLVGQSLGTGVIIGVADLLAQLLPPIEINAVVPIAGFKSIQDLLTTFKLFGFYPVLGPFGYFEYTASRLSPLLMYKFNSAERLERYMQNSETGKLLVIHAVNDEEIPFKHSLDLVVAALRGAGIVDSTDTVTTTQEDELTKLEETQHVEEAVNFEQTVPFDTLEAASVTYALAHQFVFYQKQSASLANIVDSSTEIVQKTIPLDKNGPASRITMFASIWGGHMVVPKSTEVVLALRRVLY
ncbi:Alpha/Beta hydrolase protein [Lipomyces oligophaga]|uniref:Alpha/Beta hydrolase protein n=1 Tax=Lipomyces oligophaga TaxID=45792 RepID=UPI0034D0136E